MVDKLAGLGVEMMTQWRRGGRSWRKRKVSQKGRRGGSDMAVMGRKTTGVDLGPRADLEITHGRCSTYQGEVADRAVGGAWPAKYLNVVEMTRYTMVLGTGVWWELGTEGG